jgi:hypothetical protein
MKDIYKHDFSSLPPEFRQSLHRALYRQECRAFLLAVGLLSSGCILIDLTTTFGSDILGTLATWYLALVAVFLAFWVIYPTQRMLIKLREVRKSEDGNLEREFDGSWQSVWDFVPPLLLPVGGWLVFLFLHALGGM